MKMIWIMLVLGAMFVVSCSKDEAKMPVEEKVYTLEELSSDDFEYKDGENVTVKGLCVHVCAHSGKKMFLSGTDPENKLQIFTSDKISAFEKKYEGSNLVVTGTLEAEKIDMDYINEWESELATEKDGSEEKLCEFEDSMKKVDAFKARVQKSKKGYISVYTMTGTEVKEI
jgi:hypothetical protein